MDDYHARAAWDPLHQANKQIEKDLEASKMALAHEIKLLLLGAGESGKSTLAKQMKILHLNGYTNEEALEFKPVVFSNTLSSMRALCLACKDLGIEVSPENKERQERFEGEQYQYFQGTELTPQTAEDLRELWKDAGILACFARSSEFQLLDSAKYYFDALDRLTAANYVPTTQDILRTRSKTTGINETKFTIQGTTFRMVDVGGQRSERRKWIRCFEDVMGLIFCVAMSEYDLKLYEDDTMNRMHESLKLFGEICNTQCFINTHTILFLNKKDLFEEKIKRVPLTVAFPKYDGPEGDFEAASQYISEQFVSLNKNARKKISVHITCATDTELVGRFFADYKEMMLRALIEAQQNPPKGPAGSGNSV
eukprot:m51a1_g2546 putative g-protein subunit alpha 1 (367) ;mRNA; r:292487-294528